MNKKRLISYSFVFLTILLSVLFVKAAIDIRSVTLITPANNQWISSSSLIGGSIAQFNCTANSTNAVVNLTFWTNVVDGTFKLNQSNLTALSNLTDVFDNVTYNFSIPNPPQNNTGIIWNCQAWNGTLGAASNNTFALSNFTFYVDTIIPVPEFNPGTTENKVSGSIIDITSILVNLTITETNIANITFILYNSTGQARNVTNYTGPTTSGIRTVNFSTNDTFSFTLNDGIYYFNATIVDNATNTNYTITRQITIDTTTPVPLFNEGTTENSPNNSFLNINSIFVNLTITEANIANVTFVIYNNSALIRNITNYTGPTTIGIRTINFTGLSDQIYYFNATVVDNVTRINYTITRQITLDTTLAILNQQGASDANSTSVTNTTIRNWTYINFSVTETNPSNITFTLYNSSNTSAYFLVNTTVRYLSGSAGLLANTSINFSDLKINLIYYYNATITDLANNKNSSILRRFILDNVVPIIETPARNKTTAIGNEWVNFTVNVSDNLDLAGYIFSINQTGINYTNSSYVSLSGNNTIVISNITYVNAGNKQNVTWLFYVNDTAGNWNQTPLQDFIMSIDTSSSSGSSGGSSGSSGGSSNTAPSTPNAMHSETHSIAKITPGAATIIKIVDPELGLKEIQIFVNKDSTAVKIIVTKLEGKPAVVTHEINNSHVYKYFEINKTNLLDTNLQQAKFTVQVDKSYIQNIDIEVKYVSKFGDFTSILSKL